MEKKTVKNKNNDDFIVFDYKNIKSFEIIENMSSYIIIINSTNSETKDKYIVDIDSNLYKVEYEK